METSNSRDYIPANISDEDLSKISELEKSLSKNNADIILVAYQPSEKAKK